MEAVMQSFSELSNCIMVVAAAVVGFFVYMKKPAWCDKILKKCDTFKRVMFSFVIGIVALAAIRSFMPGGGGYYAQ